jgi:methionine-rich copper-binding protein CopC
MGRALWLVVGAATRPRTLVGVTTLLRLLIAASLAVAGSLTFAVGASGHASLLTSSPEDGAVLDVAPEDVRFTFSEELFAELIEVSVLDAAGDLVMATEAEQTPPPGTDVIVPWPSDLPSGEYSVAFRVVSADGHPVTGRITFSYAAVAESAEEPTAEPTTEPTPELFEETADPSPEEVTSADDAPSSTETEVVIGEDPTTRGEPNSSIIGPLLIAAAVIVGIGVVFSLIMLARQRN